MDVLGKILAIFLAVILMLFWPLLFLAQKQEMMIQTYVLAKTALFTETVKNSGVITRPVYQRFLRQLNETGCLYEIQMECQNGLQYDEETRQYASTFQDEMLSVIYGEEGEYQMRLGDYFSVCVRNRSQTLAARLEHLFLGPLGEGSAIYVTFGGIIRDEIDESGSALCFDCLDCYGANSTQDGNSSSEILGGSSVPSKIRFCN